MHKSKLLCSLGAHALRYALKQSSVMNAPKDKDHRFGWYVRSIIIEQICRGFQGNRKRFPTNNAQGVIWGLMLLCYALKQNSVMNVPKQKDTHKECPSDNLALYKFVADNSISAKRILRKHA